MPFDYQTERAIYSYGCGSMTDGYYKLIIHVANYVPNDALIQGAHISVKGRIHLNYEGDMTSIIFFLINILCQDNFLEVVYYF